MSALSSQTKGFVTGVVTTSLVVAAYWQCANKKHEEVGRRDNGRRRSGSTPSEETHSSTTTTITTTTDEAVMDSVDLPLRMIRKAETVIQKRTSRVIVVVERCTNEHNYSAILRTVEALGIQTVYIICAPTTSQQESNTSSAPTIDTRTGKRIALTPTEQETRINHHLFAQRAAEWLTIREFGSTKECLDVLRNEDDCTIWATDLSQKADCLTVEGLCNATTTSSIIPSKLAIVFGTEAVGCSNEMLTSADRRVYLPLYGFADSLNLSVATALCLLQLFHLDPSIVGHMSENEQSHLRKHWYTKLATQRILTSTQKKHRAKIVTKIRHAEEIEQKKAQPDSNSLTEEQLDKANSLPKWQAELDRLDAEVYEKAIMVVQPLLNDPPPPLSDMRRADEHRTCFVGKNTRQKYTEEWKDMPATENAATHSRKGVSASFFRDVIPDDLHRKKKSNDNTK